MMGPCRAIQVVLPLLYVLCLAVAACEAQYSVPGGFWIGWHILITCDVHNYGLSLFEAMASKAVLSVLAFNIEITPTLMLGVPVGDLSMNAGHEVCFRSAPVLLGRPRARGFLSSVFSSQHASFGRVFCLPGLNFPAYAHLV